MEKFLKFLGRFMRGEDVILVTQTKEQWNRQFSDGKWDRLQSNQANTAEIAKHIFALAGSKNERLRVLDVGCGNGGLARLLADEFSVAYTGIDISETALGAARAAAPQGRFVVADATYPPGDLGVFDILVFNEVFFYIDPDAALPRYRAHGSPDTRLLISVIHTWRTPFIFNRIRRYVRIEDQKRVADGQHAWDVVTARFL